MKGKKPATVGARIRSLRIQKGLSQKDVAAPLLTSSYVSLIEADKRIPSDETLGHIAERLGVDPVELRTGQSPAAEAELELRLQEARRKLHSGDRRGAGSVAEAVRSEARKGRWRRVEARALCVLAVVEEHNGRPEAALERYRESESLWREDPEHLRYEAVAGVARCTMALGDSRLAIHVLNEYLDDLERSGHPDPVAQMRAHAGLVACYLQVGLRNKAAHEAELALRFAPLTDDPAELACLHMNVASSLLEQGRHADAVDSARKAEEHFSMLDWKLGAAWAQMNRGIVLLEKQDLDEARAAFEAALARLEPVPNAEVDRANVLNELAQVERMSGRVEQARARLDEARGLIGPAGPALVRATNRREMGRAVVGSEPAQAERELRDAMQLFREAGALREVASTAKELAKLLRERKKQKEALAVLEEGLDAALQSD